MASGNMKDIKRRIKSVQSTMQITKAMELVASSKMRRAKERALAARPYFNTIYQTITRLAAATRDNSSVYTRPREVKNSLFVVIAGDRGLAGGYNANLFKEMEAQMAGKDCIVLPIGKKAVEYYKRRKVEILTEEFAEVGDLSVSDCFTIAKLLCKGFKSGDFGHAALGYTNFISMLSQRPGVSGMLPLEDFSGEEKDVKKIRSLILYEPDAETVFDSIVPEYLAGLLYGAMCESVASELAARRTAMDAATKNAGEMIEQLSLYYNRARQASITQEITEIVAGAEEP